MRCDLSVFGRAILASLSAGLLLTACGGSGPASTVIGVRPLLSAPANPRPLDTAALVDALTTQLNQRDNYAAIADENALAFGELPIDSTLTLRQSERLASLQVFGNTLVSNRLGAMAKLQGQVAAAPIAGSEKAFIGGMLSSASVELNAMNVTIAKELLVDGARHDVAAIAAFRIYGLLIPQIHLLVAAYQLEKVASIYGGQISNFQFSLNQLQATGQANPAAQAALNAMEAQVAAIRVDSASALSALSGLTPRGYPGNKQQVIAARRTLNAGKAAGDVAAAYGIQIRQRLGL